ncbi:hypothetical protein [Methylomicrobium album]|uniref:Uncharacterized protein n=1 Tax=Methylomicrobium album BG8 TaxID=686340 RepID=H8GFU7_METAL|nr:hypothetical protein [Methylomicrobium album]EIC28698.1 hypothetical protein Metal_0874 [Methylomicrobium album BG8]
MVFYSFNLAAFTLFFFVLGMIKPKWPLFFLKEPTRFMILMITPILIMITVTLYGEGLKREREEKALQETPAKVAEPAPVPVPVPATDAPPSAPASKK